MPTICLIDASGYIHRAFHALPPLTNSKGEPVGAVYGYTRMISKVLKDIQPDYVAVCYDDAKPTFRHDQQEDYKGTREETDEALVAQFPVVENLTKAWGLPGIKMEGFEADDLIATLATSAYQKNINVIILSGDKDLFQLVRDGIIVRDEIRKVDYDSERVIEKYGVRPDQFIDMQSLMGDKVDNIPGVPGVGVKTAAKLLNSYENLEGIFDHLDELKPALSEKLKTQKDAVLANRTMVALRTDVPIEVDPTKYARKPINESEFQSILKRLEFRGDFFGLTSQNSPAPSKAAGPIKVSLVVNEKELESLIDDLKKSVVLGFDLETDGLNPRTCRIVGFSFSVIEGKAWYVPVKHDYLGVPQQLPLDHVIKALHPVFNNEKILKIAHNLKFDNSVLKNNQLNVSGPVGDTMLAAYCLNPGAGGFGLKALAKSEFGERMKTFEETVKAHGASDFSKIPLGPAAEYAGADAETTLRLWNKLEPLLKDEKLIDLYSTLELPLVEILADMENTGIRINKEYLREVGETLFSEVNKYEKEIFELAGETFVLNSPKQLSRILFEKLKLPVISRTKTGFSTKEDVLRKLASQHPICEKIISYRELSKLISTYVESLESLADPDTHRIHTSFHQTGTSTGRLSSSDPNLQNIPVRSPQGQKIKRAFIPSEGHQFLSADYSQIDLRALAHMSQDPVLVQTFKAEGDIHTTTAAQVFHVDAGEVTKEMRRRAKAINFGIVYGQQSYGLSQTLGIPQKEAQDFIDRYFERYAAVKNWIQATLDDARRTEYVTTIAGRRRHIPEINSPNAQIRGNAERIAINTPIQGTSADIIKAAMIHIYRVLRDRKLASKLLVQVHDELLFEVPENEMDVMGEIIKAEMEGAMNLMVPLRVDIKAGSNWNDMDPYKVLGGTR